MSAPKGTHLDRSYDYNAPGPTTSFTQSLRKYPSYATINVRSPSASSIYHALQASVEKRFSQGLSFLVSYTYSKAIDDASLWKSGTVAVTNFHLERGLSTSDARNRFVASYTYDLPYGRGRQFGSSSPTLMNVVFGRWQTNGIVSIQSGNPLDPTTGLQLSGTQTGTRPDVICDPNNFDTTRHSGSTLPVSPATSPAVTEQPDETSSSGRQPTTSTSRF